MTIARKGLKVKPETRLQKRMREIGKMFAKDGMPPADEKRNPTIKNFGRKPKRGSGRTRKSRR